MLFLLGETGLIRKLMQYGIIYEASAATHARVTRRSQRRTAMTAMRATIPVSDWNTGGSKGSVRPPGRRTR